MPQLRTAMHVQKRNEDSTVPNDARALMQPYKPTQRNGLSKSLHIHSRRIAQYAAMFPAVPRRSPSVSQVKPAPFALRQPQEQEKFR